MQICPPYDSEIGIPQLISTVVEFLFSEYYYSFAGKLMTMNVKVATSVTDELIEAETHKLHIIGSYNGLSPVRRQAII